MMEPMLYLLAVTLACIWLLCRMGASRTPAPVPVDLNPHTHPLLRRR